MQKTGYLRIGVCLAAASVFTNSGGAGRNGAAKNYL
jgi:hypothetical protein